MQALRLRPLRQAHLRRGGGRGFNAGCPAPGCLSPTSAKAMRLRHQTTLGERMLELAVPDAAWSLAVLVQVRLLSPGACRLPFRERSRPSLEIPRPCMVSPLVP